MCRRCTCPNKKEKEERKTGSGTMEKERSLRIETTKVAFAERVFAERVNILINVFGIDGEKINETLLHPHRYNVRMITINKVVSSEESRRVSSRCVQTIEAPRKVPRAGIKGREIPYVAEARACMYVCTSALFSLAEIRSAPLKIAAVHHWRDMRANENVLEVRKIYGNLRPRLDLAEIDRPPPNARGMRGLTGLQRVVLYRLRLRVT